MTSITQNPVKFYKYSTKTQYTSDSSNRDSTNGVAFVADEKAIYQGGVKYGASGYTGNVTINGSVFKITDGLITAVAQPTILASADTESTSTQYSYRLISLLNCAEIFNPDTTNYDYIIRYTSALPQASYPQLWFRLSGANSFPLDATSTAITFDHVLTSSELSDIAAMSGDPHPCIVILYSNSSTDTEYLDATEYPTVDTDAIQLIKRPKIS